MANPSAETIIGLARDLIRAEGGSDIPAVGTTFLLKVITDVDREVFRAHRRGGGNPPSLVAREDGNDLASETAINDSDGITTSDTTITVDSTTGYDSAGAAVIWNGDKFDIFFYTGITATSFTGVTGLAFSHDDNEAIQPLYALPSNFGSFRRSDEYGDGVMVSDPLYYREGPPTSGHFSIVDDGTTKYLWLYRDASGEASYIYNKKTDTLDSIDDTISFPADWQFFYAWRCIELGVFGRGDYNLMALAKQKGDSIKLDLLKDRNVGRRVRVRPLMMFEQHHELPDSNS